MQITTTKTEQITVEIPDGFYKNREVTLALLDEKIIKITRFSDFLIMQVSSADNGYNTSDLVEAKPITKEEFHEAYNEAITFVNDKLGLTHYGL